MDTLQFPGPLADTTLSISSSLVRATTQALTELEKLKFIAKELREADEDLREDLDAWEADAARDSRLIDKANARAINRG